MRLSPFTYDKLVRPRIFVKKYISNLITQKFKLKGKKVLDFGCGTGSNCLMCEPSLYLGIDADVTRIRYARKKFPKYSFVALNKPAIPAKDNYFDYICILATIHHIPTHLFLQYVDEFWRVLKPNGRIIVIEPCLFPKTWFNNHFMKLFDRGKFIRSERKYFELFKEKFNVTVHKRMRKLLFYNELLFSAEKK